ncbi:MAG TPA: rod shape-determining protein MreC [Actinomycetota bacterium]|nr:rod shape-determining protein MreC [Actinomycetota bacterium]
MWRRQTRHRSVIVALVLATIVVLTLDFRTGLIDGLSGATTEAVGVFQAGVRTLVRPVESAFGIVGDFGQLREENRGLREENERLRRQEGISRGLVRENARLKELSKLEDRFDLDRIRARVTGSSLTGLEKVVTIDKGSASGVVDDAAVLGPEGLVGRVLKSERHSSTVLLLTDSQSSVGVKLDKSGETGLVRGTGRPTLSMELVAPEALKERKVRVKDVVLTSGCQGGIFPPGIPLGQVERVDPEPRGHDYAIEVKPFARLSALDIVTIASPIDSLKGDSGTLCPSEAPV